MADFEDRQAAWQRYWALGSQYSCFDSRGPTDTSPIWQDFIGSIDSGARVLDLACGGGALTRQLSGLQPDAEITGVDYSVSLPEIGGVSRVSAALESLPFPTMHFDVVVSQFGFEYADGPQAAAELARVLAPHGRFALLMHHVDSAVHQHAMTERDGVADLLAEQGIIHGAFVLARTRERGQRDTAQLEAAVAQRFKAATEAAMTPTREWALDFFAEMMEQQAHKPLAYLQDNVMLLDQELRSFHARMDAMIGAAIDMANVEALRAALTQCGCADVVANVCSDADGRPFAWWVTGHRDATAVF